MYYSPYSQDPSFTKALETNIMKSTYTSLQAVRGEKGLSSGKWNRGLAKDKCIHLERKQCYFTALGIYSWVANYSEGLEASEWYIK